jgi:hypothetical protein
MRLLFITATSLALAGCATPSSVQRESDYELCRLSILRPPLQSATAINEADRQIRIRRTNCAAYASTILQQQQQGLQQMQQGLGQMQRGASNQQQYNLNRPMQSTSTCTKIGDTSRQMYTFNTIACPPGFAPSF